MSRLQIPSRRGLLPSHPALVSSTEVPQHCDETLRLVSLNVAHGRRTATHQALLSRRVAERNVGSIAQVIRELSPHVVGLQEADGPSAWSGNFDHVATLAERTELPNHVRGDHNHFGFGRFNVQSGTALLSDRPLEQVESHRFGLNWRDTKGFVVAKVTVPEWRDEEIDVVSVHLDFLRPSVRRRQILRMVDTLLARRRPRVLLGDLNCCWHREPRSLRLLEETLGLRPHQPEDLVPTFPVHRPRRRLDWILISDELEFGDHHTLHAPLSDHLSIVADLRLRG
ncbi:MAG: endonuclease/exonuclease/phosphatase family protein [Acidobacteriota bacterium]